jgi:hypothetical protein
MYFLRLVTSIEHDVQIMHYGEPMTTIPTQEYLLSWLSIFLCMGEWTGLETQALGLHPGRITSE